MSPWWYSEGWLYKPRGNIIWKYTYSPPSLDRSVIPPWWYCEGWLYKATGNIRWRYSPPSLDRPVILPWFQFQFQCEMGGLKEVCSWTENVSSTKVVTTKICPSCQSYCLIRILCIQREWESNVLCIKWMTEWPMYRNNHKDKNIPSLYIFLRTPL